MRQLYTAAFLFLLAVIGTYYLITQRLDLSRYFPPDTSQLPGNPFRATPVPPPSAKALQLPVPALTATPYTRVRLKVRLHGDDLKRQSRAPSPLPMPTMPQVTPNPVPSFEAVTPFPMPHTPPPVSIPTYGPPLPGTTPSLPMPAVSPPIQKKGSVSRAIHGRAELFSRFSALSPVLQPVEALAMQKNRFRSDRKPKASRPSAPTVLSLLSSSND